MKTLNLILLSFAATIFYCSCNQEEALSKVIDRGLTAAGEQSLLLAEALENREGALPKTYENGELKSSRYRAWTSGFFPGVLWYLYENNPREEFRKYAELYTARVEPVKDVTSTHDLGFMLYCSFGNGYRLTGNPEYLEVMKTGATSLSTRYNETIGAIRSWDFGKEWQFPVIIDNMMNLEFLSFISKATGDERFMNIADTHAQTTLANHFRPDYSSFHVVSYDTISGQPHAKNTHQGYSDESSWARGQAWALYGYTMMHRESGKPEYLEQARNIASFITNHPNMPEDKVPYWDFDAPEIPDALRDASAAAIMASALIELSQLDKSKDGHKWLKFAEDQIRSLSSPEYLAETGSNGGFILKHGVGNHNSKSEMDVPLTYGDYYYVEALMRLKNYTRDEK